ncbi:MAG TPA: translational GTPase TypA [Kiritimatiellia bacterium]|nr:translational GTPase TypA [Kiritimatiellia bacterium]HRZ13401.1 translational GTPase TypA [Kiritimatiellia bacterium]HSA18959.1 translational GTPase TypA [Kiritimatiellia bacterium]
MSVAIRNIGIIAHVDHGKTTLVDCLLRQAGTFRDNEELVERVMDSMDLEREKGITIKAKNASIEWGGATINIVDTPGHADFGGEVERILTMVDGVLLLVDAAEGTQAQTRFVLRKAIEQGLAVVVVLNKVDRPNANVARVHDQVLELLLELHASEAQFHAPFLFASARDGYAVRDLADEHKDMTPLFETILSHIPAPKADPDAPFRMVISNLDWSDYIGRIAIGKVLAGSARMGDSLVCIHKDGKRERATITRVMTFRGVKTSESAVAVAGSIVGLAGFEDAHIGETVCDSEEREPEPVRQIDPPTIQMQFGVNDSPLSGREGRYLTARHLKERLVKETRLNVSIEIYDTDQPNFFGIRARGALQIAILAETMRREGYELLVSRPEVIYREEGGVRQEPYETLWIETPDDILGDLLQHLAGRRALVTKMEHHPHGVQIEAEAPTRGLIGLESALANLTSGRAVMSRLFRGYGPVTGDIRARGAGVLVSMEGGVATSYALDTLQLRGRMFIGPGDEVYEGMIVGDSARSGDLPVNPTRTKHLTNIRAAGKDDAIILEPPVELTIEKAIEFIAPDEYVEVTPGHIRLRKKILNSIQRKRAGRTSGE